MMNECFKHLKKIEFVITYACTGKCKHCSEGAHELCGGRIDSQIAVNTVKAVCSHYPIETVMTFGGEPLLYPEAVYSIHAAARDCGVAKRQVITNGYFSKDLVEIESVAEGLWQSGVNEVLLSVDAFHQETIPLEYVMYFAHEVKKRQIGLKLSPAWLVSYEDMNPYNQMTRELLASFEDAGFVVGEGNVVFPEGNAIVYLKEYFQNGVPQNPYVQNPYDVECLSFDPDGSVLGDTVYDRDILEILRNYKP